MTNLSEAIRNRRSIRKYTQQPVPLDIVREIIQTATYAPSAHNAQPWRFIILTQTQKKRTLSEAMANAWRQDLKRDGVPPETLDALVEASAQRFTDAPVLVVACLTMEGMTQYPVETRQKCERDLGVQSLAAAIQSLLLAVHDKGLGACWYCAPVFCKDAVRQALGIPANVEPQALITVGYAAEVPAAPLREAFEVYSSFEGWNE